MSSSRLIRGSDSGAQVVAWLAPEVPNPGSPGSYRRSGDSDLDAIQQRAWQKGFDQGRAAGVEAGTRELGARIEAIERIHAYTEELDAVAFQENKLGSRCSDSKHRSSWRSSQ